MHNFTSGSQDTFFKEIRTFLIHVWYQFQEPLSSPFLSLMKMWINDLNRTGKVQMWLSQDMFLETSTFSLSLYHTHAHYHFTIDHLFLKYFFPCFFSTANSAQFNPACLQIKWTRGNLIPMTFLVLLPWYQYLWCKCMVCIIVRIIKSMKFNKFASRNQQDRRTFYIKSVFTS